LDGEVRGYNHETGERLRILPPIALFQGIDDLDAMLQCLGAETRRADKDAIILLAGDKPKFVGIVLSGLLHIVREDYDGNRSLMAAIAPGEIFAESLCCAGVEESPVTVIAATNSTVLLLHFERTLRTCSSACESHHKLIENMLRLVANKNLFLQTRIEIMALKSVRAKVLCYLESFGTKRGENFAVPFNREQLADYLCMERRALSHELARMTRDGVIEYRKNRFTLL
jgi:CRP-like cAMP-binding protein